MVLLATKCFNDFRKRGVIVKIKEILTEGGRLVFYNQKFLIILWFTNALLSFVLTIPVYLLLTENIGHSLISNVLANSFNYVWLLQFFKNFSLELSQIPILLYGVIIIYILLNAFYAAGLIAIFNQPNKNHVIDFFYGGVKYWFRFIKVVAFSIIFYSIVFFLYELSGNLSSAIWGNSTSYYPDFIFRLVRYILFLFLIGIISLISDYTRVAIVTGNNQNVLNEILKASRFVAADFNKIFTIFLIVALFGAGGAILYNFVGLFIPHTSIYFLLLTFFLQQILIIFRLNIRMFFFSTEVILYKDFNAETINEKITQNEGV